ncbi:MAG TPA: hypothetical protein VIX82_07575 [Solirubrobacteraceae bacterium]
MAYKSASAKRGLPGEGVWDQDFAPDAFAEFDFPRRRITGGKGRSSDGDSPATNGNGRVTNGNGRSANGNGRIAAAAEHGAPAAIPDSAPRAPQPARSSQSGQGVAGRRTITITGYGADRNLPSTAGQSRRRPAQPRHERPGFRADRAALWAFLLGIALAIAAVTSSHAAVLRAVHTSSAGSAAAHVATAVSARPVAIAAPRRARGF